MVSGERKLKIISMGINFLYLISLENYYMKSNYTQEEYIFYSGLVALKRYNFKISLKTVLNYYSCNSHCSSKLRLLGAFYYEKIKKTVTCLG